MGTDLLDEVSLNVNRNIQEMVSVQGYIVAGTEDGALFVIGQGPWVEVDDEDPVVLEDETEFAFSFTSTQSGTYSVLLHATGNDDGIPLQSGSVVADEVTEVNLTATNDYLEGENALRIVVTSEEGMGHDTFTMKIDTPPSTPILTLREVGYGDEQILLSGTAISDSDVAYYQVYLSTASFEPSDYEEGGPVWETESDQDLQIPLKANEVYNWSIDGLENDTTYYIALRAFDDGGKFSALSTVQSVIPKDTFSASQLTGETGGFCGLNKPADWIGLVLSMLLLTFRRRHSIQ